MECLSSYTDSGYPSYSKEKCSHITYSVCWPQGRGISDTAGGSRQRGGRAPPVCGGRAGGAPGPPGPELLLSPGGRGQDWSARPTPGQAQRCSSLIIRQMFLITLKLFSIILKELLYQFIFLLVSNPDVWGGIKLVFKQIPFSKFHQI